MADTAVHASLLSICNENVLSTRPSLFAHSRVGPDDSFALRPSCAPLWHLGQLEAATGRFVCNDYIRDMARDSIMRELGGLVLGQVRDALNKRNNTDITSDAPEPPVVAQLMIEIRSDGSRTIARGALNDLLNGESAKVHAEGRTPSDLILSLASSLMALPGSLFDATRKRDPEKLSKDAASKPAPAKDSTGSSYYDRRNRKD